ncbi:MAG: triphosphoribosyl-dephospho-CoA synthase [Vulcanimicrobiaceae bacterium]
MLARALARAATQSLLREVATTPKPGLVDLEHCGAHRDLCLDRVQTSAFALEAVFDELARTAAGSAPSQALREELGAIGRRGERTMLRATGGSNTHRGALWTVGLLVCAAAALGARADASTIAENAGALGALPDRYGANALSHGAIVAQRYGVSGARGEAAAGFPSVVRLALPLVRSGVLGADVFLELLARVDDTCVLHRAGPRGLALARNGARAALAAGGVRTRAGSARVRTLDRELVATNASPGGCADLLAAAFFLDAISSRASASLAVRPPNVVAIAS